MSTLKGTAKGTAKYLRDSCEELRSDAICRSP